MSPKTAARSKLPGVLGMQSTRNGVQFPPYASGVGNAIGAVGECANGIERGRHSVEADMDDIEAK